MSSTIQELKLLLTSPSGIESGRYGRPHLGRLSSSGEADRDRNDDNLLFPAELEPVSLKPVVTEKDAERLAAETVKIQLNLVEKLGKTNSVKLLIDRRKRALATLCKSSNSKSSKTKDDRDRDLPSSQENPSKRPKGIDSHSFLIRIRFIWEH